MLGVPGFEPNFFSSSDTLLKVYGETLFSLVNQSIEEYWIMWDVKENEWFVDGPVIFRIGNRNLEFAAYQLDEFSMTIDTIDLSKKLDWYGCGEELPLNWRRNALEDVNELIRKPIQEVSVLTYNFISTTIFNKANPKDVGRSHETGYMLHGIEFAFKKRESVDQKNYLSIYNALDKTGIVTEYVEQGDQIKRIKVTGDNTIEF